MQSHLLPALTLASPAGNRLLRPDGGRGSCRISARPAPSLAAVTAQNQCTLVVFLADARVGAELRKAQEAGQLATQADHGKGIQSSDRASDTRVTLEEIGIPRQRASEMKRLAEVGEPAIRAEVKRANDEERERNARIVAAREAGETVRKVAEREGVSPRTVHYVQERQTAEIARPCSTPSADFRSPEKGSGPGAKQYAGNSAELPRATVQPTPSPQQGGVRPDRAPEPVVTRWSTAKPKFRDQNHRITSPRYAGGEFPGTQRLPRPDRHGRVQGSG